jgi:hypothetical protein
MTGKDRMSASAGQLLWEKTDRSPWSAGMSEEERIATDGAATVMGQTMRCYFHLVCGSEVLPDSEGVEVTDLDVARTQAVAAIQELAQENEADAAAVVGWRLDVSDASGKVLFSVSLDRGGALA